MAPRDHTLFDDYKVKKKIYGKQQNFLTFYKNFKKERQIFSTPRKNDNFNEHPDKFRLYDIVYIGNWL